MAHMKRPGAGDSRPTVLEAGRRSETKHSPSARGLQASARVDELLVRLSDRLGRADLTSFEVGFIRSLHGQAKRGGPRWRPSERQRAVAEKILTEREDVPEESLIEEAGDDFQPL